MPSYAPRHYARPAPPGYGYVPYGYGYAPGLGDYGFPPLLALLPLAAKAAGAIAPVAMKAASAILPMAGKAAGALAPMAKGLLPQLLTSLPGLIPMPGGGARPGFPGMPFMPGAPAPGVMPAPPPRAAPVFLPPSGGAAPVTLYRGRRRRRPRRRALVRVLRDRETGVVKAVRPIVDAVAPSAAHAPVVLAPPPATEASGGMAGYGYYGHGFGHPMAGLHACRPGGGLLGPGQRRCGC